MCGIAGWINLKGNFAAFDRDVTLRAMCNRIVHRGPDSEGLWLDTNVALGMRRLSIIDLETGDQPVFNENKTVLVMLNGELYNYREVRQSLEERRHRFQTASDTEILPHLYEEYGDKLFDHVNGMFAFSLWDKQRRRLILARDRFGEKPLYYGVFGDHLIWASELKALLAHPSVSRQIDADALRHYVSFDYVPAPLSIFKGIKKLPAAHFLTVEGAAVEIKRYWDLCSPETLAAGTGANGNRSKLDFDLKAEQLRELLSDAVRMRLVSDVPLGILLSGGIDSSTVAAFAARHSDSKIRTFSIGFEEETFDESRFARLVADHIGSEHQEETLSAEKAGSLLPEIGSWLDEPLADPSLIPTYLLARFVRKSVTVALGGDGGDELFAGYPMYYAHRLAELYKTIPGFLRRGLIEPAIRKLPVSNKNLSFEFKAKRFIRAANLDDVARHHSWFGSFAPEKHLQLFTPEFLAQTTDDIYAGARKAASRCQNRGIVEAMQYVDINFYLAEDILTKVDRAAMAVSLETRAPFLDPRIGEFAAALPTEYKLRGNKGKLILKEAARHLLPAEILQRPKKGFGIPVAGWLNGRLKPLVDEFLEEKRLRKQGIFNPEFVKLLVREHQCGVASHQKELWSLLVFQLWCDNFLV